MEWLFFWIIMAIIVAMIAARKGRSAIGWLFYGFLIWPIALVHALLLRSRQDETRIPCGHCRELVLPGARVCRFCGRDPAA